MPLYTKKEDNKNVISDWSNYDKTEIVAFGDEGDFSRQFILNPTIFDLLGDVAGKKILDAGSGTGYLARKLAKKGAKVTAVEPASQMFDYCTKRENTEKLGINFVQADLSSLEDVGNDFDYVVSNMVFMDIPDYESAILNCIKALKKGGNFVFSISHPAFPGSDSDWKKQGHVEIYNYFDHEPKKERFGFTFYRPLSEYVNLVLENGCVLKKMAEPRLPKEVLEESPEATRNYFVPQFVFFKFRKK